MDLALNEVEINVRFVETDAMNVAHHSNYYSWFEVGRFKLTKYLLINGFTQLQEQKFLVPVITSQCRYYSFARFDDSLLLTTRIMPSQSVKLVFFYEIENMATKQLVAVGKTIHVLMHNDGKLILTWPEVLKRELEEAQIKYPGCFCDGEEYERKI